MTNLKIYYIDESYINYLKQFDSNVAYNIYNFSVST